MAKGNVKQKTIFELKIINIEKMCKGRHQEQEHAFERNTQSVFNMK